MIWAGLRVLEADLNNPLSGRKLPVFSARVNERLTLSAFCKRGSVNVRFAPKATEVLRCRELTGCAINRSGYFTALGAKLDVRAASTALATGSFGNSPKIFR